MAARGPVPKRSDQRRRENKPVVEITTAPAAVVVPVPDADPDWHPVAIRLFEALAKSGQVRYYEPSDWAVAYLMCESISLDLKPQFIGFAQTSRESSEAEYAVIPLKGASLAAYLKALGSLLATEGDRRRASLELQRCPIVDDDEVASVTAINAYSAQLA